jgi:hypothetical protein
VRETLAPLLVVLVVVGGLVACEIEGFVAWLRLRRRIFDAERHASRLRIEELEAQVRRLRAVLLGPCLACTGSGRCAPCDGTGAVAKLHSGRRRT